MLQLPLLIKETITLIFIPIRAFTSCLLLMDRFSFEKQMEQPTEFEIIKKKSEEDKLEITVIKKRC